MPKCVLVHSGQENITCLVLCAGIGYWRCKEMPATDSFGSEIVVCTEKSSKQSPEKKSPRRQVLSLLADIS